MSTKCRKLTLPAAALVASFLFVCAPAIDGQEDSRLKMRPGTFVQNPTQAAPSGTIVFEAETAGARASNGRVINQEMRQFGQWSGGSQLLWLDGTSGSRLEIPFAVPQTGQYSLTLGLTRAPDFGNVSIGLQGRELASFSGYSPRVVRQEVPLGKLQLTVGSQVLVIVINGKEAESTGFLVGVDGLTIRPDSPAMVINPSRNLPSAIAGNQGQGQQVTPVQPPHMTRDPAQPRPPAGRGDSGGGSVAGGSNVQINPNAGKVTIPGQSSQVTALPDDQLNAMLEAMFNPYIQKIEPVAPKGHDAGQTIMVLGQRFSPETPANSIAILKQYSGNVGVLKQFPPTVAYQSGEALEVQLPKDLQPGNYYLQVSATTDKLRKSNMAELYIRTPPPPAPVISQVASAKPGRQLLIQGSHFLNEFKSNKIAGVWLKPLDNQPLASFVKYGQDKTAFGLASVLNDSQLQLQIPIDLTPGRYLVVTERGALQSNWFEMQILPYRYVVTFTKMKCFDESDDILGGESGSDEMVTQWTVIHDSLAYGKITGEYDFDDGVIKDYKSGDRQVFPAVNANGEIRRGLAIHTICWDSDGDQKSIEKDLGSVGEWTSDIGTATGFAPAVVVGKLLGKFAKPLASMLDTGRPFLVEVEAQVWTAADLQRETDNDQKKFSGSIDRYPEDSHYRLFYEITRVED